MITLWLVGSFTLERSAMAWIRRGLTRRASVQAAPHPSVAAARSSLRWAALCASVYAAPLLAKAEPQGASNGTATKAAVTPSLSGTWNASGLKEVWSFPAWPEACGPKPAPSTSAAGPVEVVEQGGELNFSGARSYKTSNCWDQSNGIRRVTHAQNARSWTNTCKSSSSATPQVNLQTSVTASDSRITLRETGHYVYRQGGATCEADVTRTRTYSRGLDPKLGAAETPRSGAALLTPALAAPPDKGSRSDEPSTAKLADNDCSTPGPPAELRFVNLVPWVETGGSAQLTAQAVDKAGCPTRAAIQYSLEGVVPGVTLGEHSGLLKVTAGAEQGSLSLVARAFDLTKQVTLPVVSKESRSALLQVPGDEPVQANVANQPVADSIIGTSATLARDGATERKWWFAGLAGLIVVGLATLGLRLLRAGSRSGSDRPRARTSIPNLGSGGTGTADEGPLSQRRNRMPGSASITKGEIIVRDVGKTDPGRGRATTPEVFTHAPGLDSDAATTQSNRNPTPMGKKESSCPRCGTRYIDGSLYCGVDGERLR